MPRKHGGVAGIEEAVQGLSRGCKSALKGPEVLHELGSTLRFVLGSLRLGKSGRFANVEAIGVHLANFLGVVSLIEGSTPLQPLLPLKWARKETEMKQRTHRQLFRSVFRTDTVRRGQAPCLLE